MLINAPKILAIGPAGAGRIVWPGPVEWRAAPDMPSRQSLLAAPWDYCYFGFDSDILDCRLFQLAAEYAARLGPDMLLFSSATEQIPSGKYDRPEECFHILCTSAVGGGLFAMGNKIFSRKLVEETDAPLGTVFLAQAFRRIRSVAALAQPWVAMRAAHPPSDEEFFSFVEHFAGANGRE